MNFFQLKEYRHYRRLAKGRHGVHSPFVYALIDDALTPAARKFDNIPPYHSENGTKLHADILLRRLIHHFRFHKIAVRKEHASTAEIFVTKEWPVTENIILTGQTLYDWRLLPGRDCIAAFKETQSRISNNDVVVVSGMHRSPEQKQAWALLCDENQVRLSIDLFSTGLLFFSTDFKEKQHFALKSR